MEFILIGLAVAANIIFILFKYEKKRYTDCTLDFILLVLVTMVFSKSYGALVVGTVASLMISIYLYIKPPKLVQIDIEDLKRKFRGED